MKNKSGVVIIVIGSLLSVGWVLYGYLIFTNSISLNSEWARGELGDYFGGGIGAISVLFIVYTVYLQINQIHEQQNESFEAGVFRIFQALKPELEGLSARIVSKAIKAGLLSEDPNEPFSEMQQTFRTVDRTVFLRALQKPKYSDAIRGGHENTDLMDAIERYKNIMDLLDKSLTETVTKNDDDFARAIKATEVYVTYEKCFK
jgi:hypothetical protein